MTIENVETRERSEEDGWHAIVHDVDGLMPRIMGTEGTDGMWGGDPDLVFVGGIRYRDHGHDHDYDHYDSHSH